ncbi:MAG: winged helix-turn-helix transcriptional regulator [Actinomycetota bacterium]
MSPRRPPDESDPLATTMALIGDRWTMLVVRELVGGGKKFKELSGALDGIPPKVLSDRLKRLEAEGLVRRVIYSSHPLRAEYHLTGRGKTLSPVMDAITSWGRTQKRYPEPK